MPFYGTLAYGGGFVGRGMFAIDGMFAYLRICAWRGMFVYGGPFVRDGDSAPPVPSTTLASFILVAFAPSADETGFSVYHVGIYVISDMARNSVHSGPSR